MLNLVIHSGMFNLLWGCERIPDIKNPWLFYVFHFNSLAPGRFERNFRWVIFKIILIFDRGLSCEICLRWLLLDPTNERSTSIRVMATMQQQAITWAYVDSVLCRNMASQGRNELMQEMNIYYKACHMHFLSLMIWEKDWVYECSEHLSHCNWNTTPKLYRY